MARHRPITGWLSAFKTLPSMRSSPRPIHLGGGLLVLVLKEDLLVRLIADGVDGDEPHPAGVVDVSRVGAGRLEAGVVQVHAHVVEVALVVEAVLEDRLGYLRGENGNRSKL